MTNKDIDKLRIELSIKAKNGIDFTLGASIFGLSLLIYGHLNLILMTNPFLFL